jgi:hypothetical protein
MQSWGILRSQIVRAHLGARRSLTTHLRALEQGAPMTEPTDDQRRMAAMLNLHPDTPDDWPMDIIDWLIEIKATAPRRADFDLELRKVLRRRW